MYVCIITITMYKIMHIMLFTSQTISVCLHRYMHNTYDDDTHTHNTHTHTHTHTWLSLHSFIHTDVLFIHQNLYATYTSTPYIQLYNCIYIYIFIHLTNEITGKASPMLMASFIYDYRVLYLI